MKRDSKILVVGHGDIIEQSLCSFFEKSGYSSVFSCSRLGLNTAVQPTVYAFFQKHRPEYVFLGSTRSGGIQANLKSPAEFIYHNVESQNNVVYASWKFGVRKLLYLGGSCVYPRDCPQPIAEGSLLTGPLEESSEPYSIAKIAGMKLCQAFKRQYGFNAIVMVPATIYGPGTDGAGETAHVLTALISKFMEAVREGRPEVVVWGTGKPKREFLYAEDFVKACLYLMDHYEGEEAVNAGCGQDVSIRELAEMTARISGFKGNIIYDTTKPDGTMRKLLDSRRIHALGWRAEVSLEEGIRKTCAWHQDQIKK